MEAKQSKIIVRDNSGNLIQLLPEVKVDSSINQSSSNPVSGSAVASYVSGSFVGKTGNESISGQKTFVEGPYQTYLSKMHQTLSPHKYKNCIII